MSEPLSRREFLSLAPAAAVAARLPVSAFAQGARSRPQQKFRVGHNVGPYLRVGPPQEGFWKGVEELSGLGFRGTEADDNLAKLSDTYGKDPAAFRERLAKHGIAMIALYHSLPVNDASRFKESIAEGMRVGKFVKGIGASIFNLAGGTREPQDFKNLAALVNELGKGLHSEYGVRLGYHPHTGNMIEKRDEIGRMMDMTDPRYFSLCPDTGHLVAGGSDALEVFRTYRSRIIYLHFKDWDPEMVTPRTAQTGRKGGFPELGEGIVPLPAIADYLLDTGYDGWVMIEIDSSRTTPLDSARKDLAYMKDRLKLKVA